MNREIKNMWLTKELHEAAQAGTTKSSQHRDAPSFTRYALLSSACYKQFHISHVLWILNRSAQVNASKKLSHQCKVWNELFKGKSKQVLGSQPLRSVSGRAGSDLIDPLCRHIRVEHVHPWSNGTVLLSHCPLARLLFTHPPACSSRRSFGTPNCCAAPHLAQITFCGPSYWRTISSHLSWQLNHSWISSSFCPSCRFRFSSSISTSRRCRMSMYLFDKYFNVS